MKSWVGLDGEPISVAEATVRALWLVELRLLDDRGADLDDKALLKLRLDALDLPDERVYDRAVERFLKSQPTLSENLDWLCHALFHLHEGLPELEPHLPCRRLVRLINPDALAVLHPDLALPDDERHDWAEVPLRSHGETVAVLRDQSLDTHIHLGGALPPLFYWVALMGGGLPLDVLAGPAALRRGHASTLAWQRAAARAMRLRLELARWLQERSEQTTRYPFPCLPAAGDPLWQQLQDLPPESTTAIHRFLLALTAPQRRQLPAPHVLIDPLRNDPAGERAHYAAGERRLLFHLAQLLRPSTALKNQERAELERQLLEYLRIRNAFHQVLAYDHGTDGLLRFVESFSRRGFLFGARRSTRKRGLRQRRHRRLLVALERERMAAALDTQLARPFPPIPRGHPRPPLRQVEMRVSLPTGSIAPRVLRGWLQGIAQHGRSAESPHHVQSSQVGLIFHLIKNGTDPKAAARAEREAHRLINFLISYPGLRQLIVGIDAAGDERKSSPRVFGRAFAQLADFEQRHRRHPGDAVPRLGRTFHVGEDVDDLLTGLRHLHEVVTLLLGAEGGRLGHALALGEEPARFYARRSGQTEPTLGTHLLDLVWAWATLSEISDTRYLSWLENQICSLAKTDDSNLRRCAQLMSRPRGKGLAGIQCDDELLEILIGQGQEPDLGQPITIFADQRWLDLLSTLQRWLRGELRGYRLCIEANPTSNLIIGGYTRYDELPHFLLVEEQLAVSINTDDPGLFMTSLPAEIAALYGALTTRMSHRDALGWLADRVFDADQSSFLGAHVPFARQLARHGAIDALFRHRR